LSFVVDFNYRAELIAESTADASQYMADKLLGRRLDVEFCDYFAYIAY